jgi:HIRAN domain
MGFLDRLFGERSEQDLATGSASPHTWLQPYSFRATGYEVQVVGESNYQDVLEAVSGGRTPDGARVPLVTAALVREPRNRYDRNAVRVDVGGRCVGYIPRDLAPSFGAVLAKVGEAGIPPTCRAWLRGGWDRGVLDRGHFGIVLDLHPDLQVVADAPVLPFGPGRVSITGEEAAQDYLSALLDGQDRAEVIASLEFAGDYRLAVDIGGTKVGGLTPKMSARYAPWVNEVFAVGFPEATCEARLIRGPNKVEAFLKLATPWDL